MIRSCQRDGYWKSPGKGSRKNFKLVTPTNGIADSAERSSWSLAFRLVYELLLSIHKYHNGGSNIWDKSNFIACLCCDENAVR